MRPGFGSEERPFRWGLFILLLVLYALFLNPRCWPEEVSSVKGKVGAVREPPLQAEPVVMFVHQSNPYAKPELKLIGLSRSLYPLPFRLQPSAAPPQSAGPHNADQVLLNIYDALNGALKANATLAGGSTNPMPHNADQVLLASYDSTNGALRINCVVGCTGNFQVNGTGLISSSPINFQSSSTTNGLTLTFSNPSAGNVQLGLSGTLNDAGLTSAYSGVGACAANTWASTLGRNAAPTCTQPAISNLTATISSPLLLNSNTLSIQQANGSQSGYLLSGDWTAFNSKQAALTFNSPLQNSSNTISCPNCEVTTNKNASNGYAGLSGGLLSVSQLPTPTASTLGGVESLTCGSNTWMNQISTAGAPSCTQPAISNLTATISSPLLLNSNTLSIQQANGSQSGYLLSGDWTAFNSKQAALTFNSPLQNSSNTVSCPNCEVTTNKNASNGYAGLSGGLLSASQLPTPTVSTLGGVESLGQTAHQWINSISTSGVPAASQPQFGDIGGTVAASQLPVPTASSLGGVESLTCGSNTWMNEISTAGAPSCTQPAFNNISGTVGAGQLPNVPVLISTSGPVADPGGASAFQLNNASGALTFDAPAGVAGMQRCYRNATGKSGAITIQMAASNTVDMAGANGSSGGYLLSGGALGDAACIMSDATNHWYAFVSSGTWTNN